MSYFWSKMIDYFSDADYRFLVNAKRGLYDKMPDKEYLSRYFKAVFKKEIDFCNPKTYNEKLQFLKLYDRNPSYTDLVDKYSAKLFVSKVIGDQYVIPTIGVWDDFDDIDFASLPNQFVIKCTHDSGGIVICKDKSSFDIQAARKVINKSLRRNYYQVFREWPYKDVKRRILIENYMEDKSGELKDYKFFCFDGEPKAMFVATDRQNKSEETKFDFFDMDFNHLPFTNGHPIAATLPDKPNCFEEMKSIAAKLSKNIPHVRVDFYEIDDKVYFGEMTFFHWSGFVPFKPAEWDEKFGEFISLPSIE